jgi:hypothetical protein
MTERLDRRVRCCKGECAARDDANARNGVPAITYSIRGFGLGEWTCNSPNADKLNHNVAGEGSFESRGEHGILTGVYLVSERKLCNIIARKETDLR